MKIKWMLVVMLTALLMAAAPLAADDSPAGEVDKKETFRKAILEHAKLDINMFKEQLKGGLADGKAVTDFPLEQLIEGIETEMEHTTNPMLALEIAMDHLVELEDYYTRLEAMEHGHGMMKMKAHKCAAGNTGKAMDAKHKCTRKGKMGVHKVDDAHKCSAAGKKSAGVQAHAGDCPMKGKMKAHKAAGDHKCTGECAMKVKKDAKAHKCAMHKDGKAAEPCKAEAEEKATTATKKPE